MCFYGRVLAIFASGIISVLLLGYLHPVLAPVMAAVNLLTGGYYAYTHQIQILLQLGKYKRVLHILDGCIEQNQADTLVYVRRARLRYRYKKYKSSSLDYEEALGQGMPKYNAMIYTELGQIYFSFGRYRDALSSFEQAYTEQPNFHPTLAWLAVAHYALRNFDEAHIWWQYAIERHRRYAKLHGTNYVKLQEGWLQPAIVEAQKVTALLNAHSQR